MNDQYTASNDLIDIIVDKKPNVAFKTKCIRNPSNTFTLNSTLFNFVIVRWYLILQCNDVHQIKLNNKHYVQSDKKIYSIVR